MTAVDPYDLWTSRTAKPAIAPRSAENASRHQQTAVDFDHLTGHVAAELVGAQVQERTGAVVCFADTPHRYLVDGRADLLGSADAILHVGGDDARCNHVDPNALRRDFLRERTRKRRHEGLGTGVDVRPAAAGTRGDRAHVDDVSPTAFLPSKLAYGRTACGEDRPDIHRHVAVEQLVRYFRNVNARYLIGRVVDQYVEPAEPGYGFRDQPIDGAGIRDVALQQKCGASASLDIRRNLFGLRTAGSIMHGDLRPASSEAARCGGANASTGSGHKTDLSADFIEQHEFLRS